MATPDSTAEYDARQRYQPWGAAIIPALQKAISAFTRSPALL
jgi:hypothetical protein